MGGLPDRWLDYRPMGKVIPGTRFIAFKVPLKETLCRSLPKNEWFTPQHIIDEKPKISLIVDLTNTTRYYDKNVFQSANMSYVKIFCPGHVVPTKKIISEFFESVDKFLSEHPDDETLIGVHCTHGVNRTGYFICKYMIDKMGIEPSHAIEDVGCARGYPIERQNYLQDLKDKNRSEVPAHAKRDQRPNTERESRRNSGRSYNDDRGRAYNDRNTYNNRLPSNWRRDDQDDRRDDRFFPSGDGPRYGRQSRDFQHSPRRFEDYDSGRGRNWSGPSRQREQGSSTDHSWQRYNRPDHDRARSWSRRDDRPSRAPKS